LAVFLFIPNHLLAKKGELRKITGSYKRNRKKTIKKEDEEKEFENGNQVKEV
jgi:hypothetical protein